MKTYYSAQEIEDLAARGTRQLVLDGDAVLTDLARDAAQRLGVALVSRGRAQPSAPALPAPTGGAVTPPRPAARPSGCQHGPLLSAAPQPQPGLKTVPGAATNSVVDQMVGLVRQLAGKR